ncbi:hypothetical protein HY643_03705, partial [Candidatus Woesearchaeota archaeon]|nr:hypothetical protein [Candidatus Woesearchaeota archaeon]
MLKVVLTIDAENFTSFRQNSPRWDGFEKFKAKINRLIKSFRYNKKGFELVFDLIVKHKFPASFML